MTKVEQLEHEIMSLNRADLDKLSEWFQTYLSAEWDKQIEKDISSGRLDAIAQQALLAHKENRTKKL